MAPTNTMPKNRRAFALLAVLLAALAACAEPQKAVEECEPGVNEISDTANLVPGNC